MQKDLQNKENNTKTEAGWRVRDRQQIHAVDSYRLQRLCLYGDKYLR